MINLYSYIEFYAQAYSTPTSALLEELRLFTGQHTDMPGMQLGVAEGSFLKMMVGLIGAKRIVEVGTFTGYSSLAMASALPLDGTLITCELDPGLAATARRFFDRSEHGQKIRIETGPAAETLEQLDGPFDMAFIDADKGNYINYYQQLRPKMRSGGLIVADNVLWSGLVLQDPAVMDDSAKAIVAFNKYIREEQDVEKLMLTIGDGMTLIKVP